MRLPLNAKPLGDGNAGTMDPGTASRTVASFAGTETRGKGTLHAPMRASTAEPSSYDPLKGFVHSSDARCSTLLWGTI